MKAAATAAVLGIAALAAVALFREPARRETSAVVPPMPAAAVTPAPGARQRPAATGGVAILAAAVRAEAVVAGVVSEIQSLDVHGWRAALRVDRVLSGNVRLADTLTIGWEELSAARQVRFEAGQRVLLVLDPLPTQSLWRKRFPPEERARTVLIVASAGDAFVVRPDGLTLDALGHYLAMTGSARVGAPGARRLAEIVRGGPPAVAREALELLAAMDGDLLADTAPDLLAAARSSERAPALRAGALELAARRRLAGTRETARALAEPGSPMRVAAYRALAMLPEGLSAEDVERLVADADPALRAVGVASLSDPERVTALMRGDPAPVVRLAAGRTLLERSGRGAIAAVLGLLDDPDETVRTGIAESVGSLGAPAVPPLRTIVDGDSERAAVAAVLALTFAGRAGGDELATIADTHEKESLRAVARLALGEAPGHKH